MPLPRAACKDLINFLTFQISTFLSEELSSPILTLLNALICNKIKKFRLWQSSKKDDKYEKICGILYIKIGEKNPGNENRTRTMPGVTSVNLTSFLGKLTFAEFLGFHGFEAVS